MNDKERLEEIKNVYEDYKGLQKKGDFKQADIALLYLSENHIDWLIQQVEKIELLNAEIETLQAKWEAQGLMIQKLHRENQRYKQALEFYADEETYETKFATDTDEICDPFTLIELDNGEKARQALEG